MNDAIIEDMILHEGYEILESGNYIQNIDEIRKGYPHLQQNKKDIFLLLDKFFCSRIAE
jgi:hypothetical protein